MHTGSNTYFFVFFVFCFFFPAQSSDGDIQEVSKGLLTISRGVTNQFYAAGHENL